MFAGCSRDVRVDLLGTCFSVARRHVLTAPHNLCDDPDSLVLLGNYFLISHSVEKQSDYQIFPYNYAIKMKRMDKAEDWEMLEIEDSSTFFPMFIPLCPDLPNPVLNEREELKVYHAPIDQYLTSAFRT